jgi:NAD+ kinase
VIGVNFGRVGFLTTIAAEELEAGLARVFAGDYRTVELPTLEVEAGGSSAVGVNDVVATSSALGRMVELEWAIGDESLGSVPCDGIICATPVGSTAYNLSNGGPVLVWGLDAIAVTFVAPHSLHARPLVVPRSRELTVWNRTTGVDVAVIVDGHGVADLGTDASVSVRLGGRSALLATLPEATFFRRYRETFASQ